MKTLKNLSFILLKVRNILFSFFFLLLFPLYISAQSQKSTFVSSTPNDWGVVKAPLPNSFFAGMWTKVVAPIGSGIKGNDYPINFIAPEGNIIGVSGNLNFGGGNPWMYNANTMTGDSKGKYLGDWAFYLQTKTEQECRGWIYIGFYVQRVGGTTRMTTYAKINTTGAIEQSETTPENRIYNINEVNIGGTSTGADPMYMQHLKIIDMPNTPTAAQINAIALNTNPDLTAWGHWPLISGGVNDVSGNGRTILNKGKWYAGVDGPNLNVTPILADSITLNKKEITLGISQTIQLLPIIHPSTATNQNVTWTSSNKNVADVTNTGIVTAKALGSAIITVTTTNGGKTATCKVNVSDVVLPVAENVAPLGIGYGWSDIPFATSTSNTTRIAITGINDGDKATNEPIPDCTIGQAWQAVGVVWTVAQSASKVVFYNGSFIDGNGYFTSGIKIQSSIGGNRWTDVAGWNISPTYTNSSDDCDKIFTFTGPLLSNIKGIRVIGQVDASNSSMPRAISVKEFEVYGDAVTANTTASNMEETITSYPNPAQNFLNITFSQELQDVQLTVYDALGSELINNNVNGSMAKLNIEGLSSGIYILKVTTDSKSKLIRFVKQ